MGDVANGASARSELAQIDYFLDELARAVERAEVPYHSYEVLAPRYLSRRQQLVEILTRPSAPVPASAPSSRHAGTPVAPPPQGAAAAWAPPEVAFERHHEAMEGWETEWEPIQTREPRARVRPAAEPVSWSTILLFLGAFLVIVASAIFALAVWNTTGVGFKLAFLGTLTAAFYAGGFVARTKFELGAGSAALTVVGSAMLLFDCWIVISGLQLAGPMPWAVALFVCSAVYWFTEVRLGDGFYGIAGAAAQVGWWWLMAVGLHFETPVRVAGLAAIALLWHLAAERAETSPTFRSLATMLLWAAPLLSTACAIGLAADAVVVGTPSWTLVGCALAVSACGGATWLRTKLATEDTRRRAAGGVQLAVFAAVVLPGTPTWLSVGMLALVAAVYALVGLTLGGAPFALAAAGMEFIAVMAALGVVHASDDVRVAALAVLATTWALASRLLGLTMSRPSMRHAAYAAEFAAIMRFVSFGLLGIASMLVPVVSGGMPLSGVRVDAAGIALVGVVMLAWVVTSAVRRTAEVGVSLSLWSFYSLAALCAWAAPSIHSALYALSLVLLAGVWLFARRPVERFFELDEAIFGWLMRGLALLVLLGGLLAETFFFHAVESWQSAALAFVTAAVFWADAEFSGPESSAAVAGGAAVGAAYLVGAHVSGADAGGSVMGALMGLSLGLVGVLLRSVRARYAGWLAVAAALAGTVVCLNGVDGWTLAVVLAAASLTWATVVFAARDETFALPAGALIFAASTAACAAADSGPLLTVVVTGAVGLVLGVPAYLEAAGPDGAHARAGAALASAGLGGLAAVAGFGLMASVVGTGGLGGEWSWIVTGGIAEVVALLMLGGAAIAQAQRWRIELGLYLGWAAILLALLVELDNVGITTMEFYTTSLAVYLIAMGELYARQAEGRRVPVALDSAAAAVGLALPAFAALGISGAEGLTHFAWVLGLSTAAILVGVLARVRAYFLGGVFAIVVVVGIKSLGYLTQYWWVLLGLLGIAMLVAALTWERQRSMVADTRLQLADMLSNWR